MILPGPTDAVGTMRYLGDAFSKRFPETRGIDIAIQYVEVLGPSAPQLYVREGHENPEKAMYEEALDIAVAVEWKHQGRPRYVLSESLCALLSLTKAPAFDMAQLPYNVVLLEIPFRFFPIPEAQGKPVIISLARLKRDKPDSPDEDVFIHSLLAQTDIMLKGWWSTIDEALFDRAPEEKQWMARLMGRYVANILAYLTEHRECVKLRKSSRNSLGERVHDVGVPDGVVVDKVLRRYATDLVHARNLLHIRRTLQFVVRGHWRNQACGPGMTERRMRWIQPYLKGDPSFGKVVEKVLRVEG